MRRIIGCPAAKHCHRLVCESSPQAPPFQPSVNAMACWPIVIIIIAFPGGTTIILLLSGFTLNMGRAGKALQALGCLENDVCCCHLHDAISGTLVCRDV